MKRKKIIALFLFIVLLGTIGSVVCRYYPLLEAGYYNRDIFVAGVKLAMQEEKLKQTLENGEFVYAMGGNGWRFPEQQLFVMTSAVGLFRNKVTFIETENPAHRVLGLEVGGAYQAAAAWLGKKGFIEDREGVWRKGNVQIELTGKTKVSKIRIRIEDPAFKDLVF